MKKIGLMILALVLALGGLGVGYASWTDQIVISGAITTGDVCIEIICPVGPSGESEDPAPPYTVIGGANANSLDLNALAPGPDFWTSSYRTDKNVAWVTSNCYDLTPPRKAVTLTFNNVYPCYLSHLAFALLNCGTIPIKMDHVVFRDDAGAELATIYQNGYEVFDLSGNGIDDFEIYWGDNFGLQIEPGDGYSMDFYTHFMQDEGIDFTVSQTYTLTVEIVVVQWDHYTPGP